MICSKMNMQKTLAIKITRFFCVIAIDISSVGQPSQNAMPNERFLQIEFFLLIKFKLE